MFKQAKQGLRDIPTPPNPSHAPYDRQNGLSHLYSAFEAGRSFKVNDIHKYITRYLQGFY